MSEQCKNREHLECDGTVKAPEGEWGWDPCSCDCHPEGLGEVTVDLLPEGIIVTPSGKLVVEW